ncbi:hypothetical protein [Bradyrhizobium sp. HKCCYLS20291]|uniref:hypothetical protein n=1 Tax=Bradyrhizobium sp. HKCCYLS20291 TaxID=3420766 RepID=UPI003EC1221C
MEMEIKRVNFFDGQYLQKEEFNDLSDYIVHMRRRLLFVMFRRSGVVQSKDEDLRIVTDPDPAQKRFHVNAGMAIGCVPDEAEAREIVLREPTSMIDLTTQQTAFQPGDKVIVTIRYHEQKVTDPPSAGDVFEPTRILEQALVEVHRAAPPQPSDANPYVVLGEIDFNTMKATEAQRQTAAIQSALFAAIPSIRLQPNQITATGQAVTLTVTSAGGLSLAGMTPAQLTVTPQAGLSNLVVSNQQPTSFNLSFTIDSAAAAGNRTLAVTVNGVTAQDTFTVQAGLTISGFSKVDVPNGNNLFKITGTGFTTPTIVQFSKAGGSFATPVIVLNVSPTELGIPVDQIPSDATRGPVQVQSNGQVVKSTAAITPPARITDFAPAQVRPNALLTINGAGFLDLAAVGFKGGEHRQPFTGPGESVTDGKITVSVPGTATSGQITVTTAAGTVQSSQTLIVVP